MNKSPKLIKGGKFENRKGIIKYANGFSLSGFKRFYQIDLPRKNIIRAYHGHMKESKAVFVISGSIILCVVYLSNKINPSKKIKPKGIVLSSKSPSVYFIPPKFANGIMSLEKNTQVIFFSDKTVKQSEKDDYRFPEDYWGKEVWKSEK